MMDYNGHIPSRPILTYHYIVPHVPPSNNQFIGRTNFREYQAQKKTWAMLVKVYCKPAPKKPIAHSVVTLAYCFGDNRRRDPDNYSGKMILDGLVKAGIIEDDSFGKIELVLRRVDGEDKRTEITVEEK